MNKHLLITFVLTFILFNGNTQVHPQVLGVRGGGGNYGSGLEISYQMGMSEMNRLELDLGWKGTSNNGNGYSIVVFSGIYHWDWNITEGLNWYIGPGAQIGFWKWKNNFTSNNDGLIVGVGGQIGIEYDFTINEIPLLLSLDTRPMWGFSSNNGGFGYGGALSLRYILCKDFL